MRKGTNFCSQNWQLLLSEPRSCFCWSAQALENPHPGALVLGLQMPLCDVLSTQFRYPSERLQCDSPRSEDIPVVLRNQVDQERILKLVKTSELIFLLCLFLLYHISKDLQIHFTLTYFVFFCQNDDMQFFPLGKSHLFWTRRSFFPMSGQKGDRTLRPQLLQGSCEVNSLALLTTCAPGTKVILVWRVQFRLWTVN